jgi:hypothetical protein
MTAAHTPGFSWEEWGELPSLSGSVRVRSMADQFRALCRLAPEDRHKHIRELIETVYALPEDKLHEMTRCRLRAWLTMDEQEAAAIAASYECAWTETPAEMAMRRVILVRSAVSSLEPDERQRIQRLRPSVFSGLGERPDVAGNEGPRQIRPWWALWRSR